jgi:hypothetical protein
MDLKTDEKLEDIASAHLPAADALPVSAAADATASFEPLRFMQLHNNAVMRPVTTLPKRPSNADEDIISLYLEFKSEDASPNLMQSELQSLLSLPPAGLARRVRELQNKTYALQSEETDVELELGLQPGAQAQPQGSHGAGGGGR